jgi:hypothetical protein
MTHQEAGSKGGRPKLLTLEERQRQRPEISIGGKDTSNYRILRRLYLHGKSNREK